MDRDSIKKALDEKGIPYSKFASTEVLSDLLNNGTKDPIEQSIAEELTAVEHYTDEQL